MTIAEHMEQVKAENANPDIANATQDIAPVPEIPSEAVIPMPEKPEEKIVYNKDGKPRKKMGRPRAEIKQAEFEELCKIQCTEVEIMAVLGVTDKTLTRWCRETYGKTFSETFKEKREGGKASLRRAQWRLAETNSTMGIWLGKQYLDQHDEKDLRLQGGEIGVKIVDDIPKAGTDGSKAN